jgi:hypothetical protein
MSPHDASRSNTRTHWSPARRLLPEYGDLPENTLQEAVISASQRHVQAQGRAADAALPDVKFCLHGVASGVPFQVRIANAEYAVVQSVFGAGPSALRVEYNYMIM